MSSHCIGENRLLKKWIWTVIKMSNLCSRWKYNYIFVLKIKWSVNMTDNIFRYCFFLYSTIWGPWWFCGYSAWLVAQRMRARSRLTAASWWEGQFQLVRNRVSAAASEGGEDGGTVMGEVDILPVDQADLLFHDDGNSVAFLPPYLHHSHHLASHPLHPHTCNLPTSAYPVIPLRFHLIRVNVAVCVIKLL